MNNLSAGFALILFMLVSCRNYSTKQYNESGNLVINEWYSRNHLKSSKTFLDKSFKNYIYVSYYSDGKMQDSAMYMNDTVEGLRKYYEDGPGLMHSEYYKHGIMNGPHKAEYNSGITSFEGFRKNNLMVGEWKFHFLNGYPITYEYYDSAGSMKYFRKYDDSGNVMMTEGSALIQVLPERLTVQSNTILRGIIEAAMPPETKTMLNIEEVDNLSRSNRKESLVLNKPKSPWEWTFKDSGIRSLRFTITITDRKTGKQETNFDEKTFTVLPDK